MRFSYQTITWGGVVGDPVGVTSVKDLFYRANGSSATALREVAAAGYAGVEMFDGNLREFEDRPDDLRSLLDETGLELVATYTGANFIYSDILEDELWRVDRAAQLASRFGAEHLIVGGGAQRARGTSDEDYDRLAAGLDSAVKIARKHGLTASYHPHLTTIVEGPEQIERVLGLSDINLCPDTAHLTAGGSDAVTTIRRYGDRIVYAHLKDFRADPFAFLPLGEGDLDFPAILAALRDAGHDGWVTVELDSFDGPPGEAARRSRAYLASLMPDDASAPAT
jgi:inosose dehydratase